MALRGCHRWHPNIQIEPSKENLNPKRHQSSIDATTETKKGLQEKKEKKGFQEKVEGSESTTEIRRNPTLPMETNGFPDIDFHGNPTPVQKVFH